ncbi:MAG: L,D-transpeptidase [Mesorhizobium sp.]|uniref:L,D-transpeptidase family protein n=1 Tax=Mesorhizobium sp. TaxID=1871066 RepID=UPI000FE919DE|nr:L,D-transpeptidase [Mesorhizobium sp.]RWB29002.1 MAG: L,D-transpeptidase [Mesorhizobium sp.]RWB50200.1 MAG: L,D-transpeptidase [Mesorhizobium sp.]RWC30151.1 MAG: L,D-transpeptidase [Mesorhizobium sp.]RWD06910.1 MAG: L,D-transpeptidase [Mesorhizobium sp.]RWD31528.1 MAG: L,D-transpeptidase [Mesorhizobium sp.]
MICSVARSYKKKRACNEASAFLRKGLRVLTVRARPGHASQGLLQAGNLVFSCALGRGGISAGKREGDGATPLGSMRVLSGYFRNDHFTGGRKTRLAMTPIGRDLGWCEVPEDRNYNRPVKIPYGASHERMLRTDRLYDACLVLDWNISPRRRGRGSAIFFHLARPGFTPTQGCVAVTARTMARLLPLLSDRTVMRVVR